MRACIGVGRCFALACVLLGTLGGCAAGTFERLPRDRDLPEQGMLVQAADLIPERLVHVSVEGPAGQPVRLAIHESGAAQDQRIVVLIHGILSDSRMWRYVRGDLGKDHTLWAIDLMGCGQSDAPNPADLPADGYAPASLARDVLCALRHRLAATLPGTRLTLAGHSLGGMVVLRMYADATLRHEFADVLGRVDGAVLFTPVDVDITPAHQTFTEIAYANDWKIFLADVTGVLKERCAAAMLAGAGEERLATREEAQRVWEVLRDRRKRRAAQAMILQAVPHRDGHPDREEIARIVAGYANVSVPCVIVWGEWDELCPLSMGYKLVCELPHACLRIVPRSMHSVPAEHPLLAAQLIRDMAASRACEPGITRVAPRTRATIAER